MGYTTSTVHGIEVPDSSEANNVPEDIGKVVTALEAGSLVKRLTGAQIAALTAPQKPAGLLVYNTTTNRLEISDGTNFADYVAGTPVHAIGTRSGNQSMGYGTFTTVTWTAETDPNGILGASTFTLPAGTFAVAGFAFCGGLQYAGDYFQAEIIHNSTSVAVQNLGTSNGGSYAGMNVSAVISAAASDTVYMRVYNSSTGGTQNINLARLSVVKIGA